MSELYENDDNQNLEQTESTTTETEEVEESAAEAEENHQPSDGVEKNADGTYRYSARRAVEHPEEYRQPPYMRDEVGKGRPGNGEPKVQPRLKEFKGIRAGGSDENQDSSNTSTESSSRSGDSADNRSTDSSRNNSHSFNDGRQPYSSDGHDQRDNRFGSNGKKFGAMALIVVLIGGLVGSAAWNARNWADSRENASALQEIQQQLEDGSVTIEPSSAADNSGAEEAAEGESSPGESIIQKNPVADVAEDSTLITGLPDVVELVMPSVVAISTKTVYESYSQYGYNPFFGEYGSSGGTESYEVDGAGSGIIIGDDGTELWIVTNNHVVEDSNEVTVSFVDDEHVSAYIKGTDASNDLAVVGVKIADMSASTIEQVRAIQIGDSDSLRLGETVIAIGNALGIGQSVTTGIFSALDREITTDENTTLTTIQTDAAINPGNSGGALLNSAGELIGINVAKGSADNVEGMGYAIPTAIASDIIEKLTTMEPRVAVSEDEYPYLGIQLQDISSSYASTYGIPQGVMVSNIGEDSPAALGGMINHDIITAFEGVTVTSYEELVNELQYYAAGTTVTITVSRLENGEYVEKDLSITLGRKLDYTSSTNETQTPE